MTMLPQPIRDYDVAGVTLASAREWLAGARHARRACDLDISACEVAFLNELGNRASYRAAVAAVLKLWDAGARGAIAHSCSPIMLARYQRQGGIIAYQERILWRGQELVAQRIVIPAEPFARWVAKMRAHVLA